MPVAMATGVFIAWLSLLLSGICDIVWMPYCFAFSSHPNLYVLHDFRLVTDIPSTALRARSPSYPLPNPGNFRANASNYAYAHTHPHKIFYHFPRGENDMTVKEAVVVRFVELMKERNIKPNELANRAGITPSTVYSMMDVRRKELTINVIKKLCDALEITLGEFFSTPDFDALEQEIR